MKKRFAVLLAGALVASALVALPAKASVAVPDEVQIDDPQGDANFLNDQDNAYGTPLAGQGDYNQAGLGTSTDLLKVWFSNDATDVSLHFQTNGNPGNLAYDTYFRFSSNVGEGSVASDTTRGCLQWVASVNGAAGAYGGETEGTFLDKCNVGGDAVVGPLVTEEVGDGTFVTTITFPRTASPLLVDGGTITAPFGVSRVVYVAAPAPVGTAAVATIDNTQRGTDYEISSGGPPPAEPPTAEPPGKDDPPGQGNQKCSKIKDKKKKKACKKNSKGGQGKGKGKGKGPKSPPVEVCEAYEPGEAGAEAETLVVTHEQTEEAPAELAVATGPGVGAGRNPATFGALVSHAFVNLQVDIEDASGGLWVTLSSADYQDYDLYLDLADGTNVASAGGFGPEQDGEEGDSHTDVGSETLTGIKTNDCGGYTLDIVGAATQGGNTTLTAWIGDELWDPAAGAPVGKRMVD